MTDVQVFAIVTGGTQEEGLSTAEALALAGRRVSIWDDDAVKLASARAELAGLGLTVDARCVDIADRRSVASTYAAVRDEYGPAGALFNMSTLKNTYMLGEPEDRPDGPVPFWELDMDRLERATDINVLGMMFCTAIVGADMVARKAGSIVTQTTGARNKLSPDHIPYGPSKAFVESFTAGVSQNFIEYGVTMNLIAANGRVNRRGAPPHPKRQPANWMAPTVEYLTSNASAGVTAAVFAGGAVQPTRMLR